MATRIACVRSRCIAFVGDGHQALQVTPDSTVRGDCFGLAQKWDVLKLHVVRREAGVIAPHAWTGNDLSAITDGGVSASFAGAVGDWVKWRMEKGHDDTTVASLSVAWGKVLRCDEYPRPWRNVNADRTHAHEREHLCTTENPNALTNFIHRARIATSYSLIFAASVATTGALAVPLLGFGTAGVSAGSIAAAIQSAFYGGATTGAFSILQSVGATMAWVQVGVGGAATATAGVAILPKGNATDRANSSDEQNQS